MYDSMTKSKAYGATLRLFATDSGRVIYWNECATTARAATYAHTSTGAGNSNDNGKSITMNNGKRKTSDVDNSVNMEQHNKKEV